MALISEWEIVIRVLVAAALGAVVGIERELNNQPAGLRTHMILVVGAALAMCLSINISIEYDGDPARLAAQVISGIGFLGAGAIMRYGFNVKGLTTATTLWSMAIVGMAVGYGYYIISIAITIIMLITLTLLNFIEKRWVIRNVMRSLTVEADDQGDTIKNVRKTISKIADKIESFTVQKNIKTKRIRIKVIAHIDKGEKMESLTQTISNIEGVRNLKVE